MILRSVRFRKEPVDPSSGRDDSEYFDGAATIPGVRRAMEREAKRGRYYLEEKLNQVVPSDVTDTRIDSPYVWELPLIKYIQKRGGFRFSQPVTLIAGDNGSGKSTFLEGLALNLNFSVAGGRYGDPDASKGTNTESALSHYMLCDLGEPILRGFYLRSESHMKLLENESGARVRAGRNHLDVSHNLMERSHGESIYDVLLESVDGKGLYILDEPEAGLSIVRQMALLAEIQQAVERGAQFIIATHSPIFLAARHSQIVELGLGGDGDVNFPQWEETETVRATREFMDDPQGSLDLIFGDSLHPDFAGASAAASRQDTDEANDPDHQDSK